MKDVTVTIKEVQMLLLPDPADRTENDPIYLMSSSDVLKLTNKFIDVTNCHSFSGESFPEITAKRQITKAHLEEIQAAGLAAGWSEVIAVGKQLLFVKKELVNEMNFGKATELRTKAQPIEVQTD